MEQKSSVLPRFRLFIHISVFRANASSVVCCGGVFHVVEDNAMEEEEPTKELQPTKVKSLEGHTGKVQSLISLDPQIFSCKWCPQSDVLATGYVHPSSVKAQFSRCHHSLVERVCGRSLSRILLQEWVRARLIAQESRLRRWQHYMHGLVCHIISMLWAIEGWKQAGNCKLWRWCESLAEFCQRRDYCVFLPPARDECFLFSERQSSTRSGNPSQLLRVQYQGSFCCARNRHDFRQRTGEAVW